MNLHRSVNVAPLLMAALFLGCADGPQTGAEAIAEGPRIVTVERMDGRYRLLVDGEPFFVKGAGLERQPPGVGSIALLAEHGANALRTWRTDEAGRSGREILDEAHEHGVMVMMGLEIGRERSGQGVGIFDFDYDDPEAVAAQLDRVRGEVLELMDHPALLGWGIGNELNLGATNPNVWNAVNGISEMIHEVDPNHVTTTMLAGISPELAQQLRVRAPDLDIISVQSYADIINLPRYIEETGLERPYLVTEWGATGHWEVATTPWGVPIENTSSVKAGFYLERYNKAIASDQSQCLGSLKRPRPST
jgi:beta-galactosidase/beta-glucuronidase